MDKRALAQKIKALDGLSNDEKSALLELLHERKKYGIVWEDKPEDVETQLINELPVLTEVKERAIISDDADAPNHILIEGDNLHALTALSYTHASKIDVIYIDPPYNTGNKDFIFNDSYVDKEDSYRHSKWLSFMKKRLEIAKQLLSDKGVIFISIDDNEQANLKMLCDEVFGEKNFITNFIWQSTAGSNTGTDIITVTEYVLLYSKNRNFVLFNGQEIIEDNFPYTDKYESIRGKYTLDKLDRRRVGGHYSEALNFPIECPDGTKRWPGGGTDRSSEGWNYLWSTTKVHWGIENGFIVFKKGKDGWNVYNKRYSRIDNTGKAIDRTIPFRNLITSDLFNTAQGTAEITSIFGTRMFDFPKPSNLIKYLLTTIVRTHQSSIILDFFAGSGTTMHATMQLNAEDGGHRQCILVTNNENNICEDVTYVRNQRVILGYTKPKGETVEGLHSNNLRYYKTDFVSRKPSLKNRQMLMAVSTDLLCIKNDVYQEQCLFCGKKWKTTCLRFFANEQTQMLIIYNEKTIPFVVQALKNEILNSKIRVYVFSNSRYAFEDDFVEILDKVELCALPAAIYDAYQNVLPPLPPELLDEEVENHD